MESTWQILNNISLKELAEARKQLHQAVQLVSIPPRSFLPKVKDDHFASLRWNKKNNLLESQPWGKDKFKTAISFNNFSVLLFNADKKVIDGFELNNISYRNAYKKLKMLIKQTGEDINKLSLSLPYEITSYQPTNDIEFNFFDESLFLELGNYFNNASLQLEDIVKKRTDATEVSCWPHHFDIATLIVLNDSKDNYKSIGVGLSPGDDNYNQPYFYITPWPYTNIENMTLPVLPSGGFWHTKGWVGSVLTSENILKFNHAEKQFKTVKEFINSGIDLILGMINIS